MPVLLQDKRAFNDQESMDYSTLAMALMSANDVLVQGSAREAIFNYQKIHQVTEFSLRANHFKEVMGVIPKKLSGLPCGMTVLKDAIYLHLKSRLRSRPLGEGHVRTVYGAVRIDRSSLEINPYRTHKKVKLRSQVEGTSESKVMERLLYEESKRREWFSSGGTIAPHEAIVHYDESKTVLFGPCYPEGL